ncbi:ankyrin repeat and LEM domain containing 1 [Columba livia]|uniref:Ankyrin repeat and LEM domain containing 1 n=1 Tax=Columba livia TaxID=8932 RepID=A0A2I0LIB4_COLLI|nr:ankyrin repeat and LEM domain containing 1 [Columba livia]
MPVRFLGGTGQCRCRALGALVSLLGALVRFLGGTGRCRCRPLGGAGERWAGRPRAPAAAVSGHEGKEAIAMILRDLQHTRGWDPVEDPWVPRRSLSFLTEDDTEGSVTSGVPSDVPEPLSSTRKSLLEELGGGCGSGDPLLCSAGDITPGGLEPPRHLHVTPRTRSRLQASAQRLGASSSSSLFDETLEMPRRPPRIRAPRGVPRDPVTTSGHCVTPGGEDVSSGDREGTGSLDDTEILPRALSQISSPGSSPTVLLPPSVSLLPTGCSTRCTRGHPEDEEGGQVPTKCHSPSTEATSSPEDTVVLDGRGCRVLPRPLSDESLRRRLRALGDNPGPVTEFTRRLYLRRLEQLAKGHQGTRAGHSPELVAALRTGRIPDCGQDELVLAQQFDRPNCSRRWREGLLKSSFNYLLLDPRITQDLPLRSHQLSPAECFRTFIKSIFYVGKGTRARPYVRRILEIWASGHGVVSVLCFQNCVPAEAYTRESCLVEALGLQTITNQRKGNCYGAAASWPAAQRRRLGVHMLHRALRIFLAEGERQLRPHDIPGGGRGAPPACTSPLP